MKRLLARLHRDESGNVMVLAVAGSLLLVAMVWAIIGTGQRLVQKETIQSSADAAAFSAAVIKAKGLNLIAFCNLVMALLFAIAMLLRIIKYALISAAVLVSLACLVPGAQALCSVAATLDDLAAQFSNWEPRAEQTLQQGMQGLAQTERAVAKITPVLALVEAYHVGTDGAYQKSFGKGALVTVAYPLPTSGLPVKDGTCDDLKNQAAQDYGNLTAAVVAAIGGKTGLSASIGQKLGDIIKAMLEPLGSAMCGGSGTIPTTVRSTSCGQCLAQGQQSAWAGTRLDANGQPAGPGQCVMNKMPSWGCPSAGGSAVTCDSDGAQYRDMVFQFCDVKQDQPVSGNSNWPKPLVLDDQAFATQRYLRAFTVLTDANVEARRRAVGIAARTKPGAPVPNQLLGMAQAEIFGFNGGHADLWHMDWRARLVRFRLSDGSDRAGDAGGAGIPAGAIDAVSGAIDAALGGAGGLSDQFLLH